jgi:hypothetical protein
MDVIAIMGEECDKLLRLFYVHASSKKAPTFVQLLVLLFVADPLMFRVLQSCGAALH